MKFDLRGLTVMSRDAACRCGCCRIERGREGGKFRRRDARTRASPARTMKCRYAFHAHKTGGNGHSRTSGGQMRSRAFSKERKSEERRSHHGIVMTLRESRGMNGATWCGCAVSGKSTPSVETEMSFANFFRREIREFLHRTSCGVLKRKCFPRKIFWGKGNLFTELPVSSLKNIVESFF